MSQNFDFDIIETNTNIIEKIEKDNKKLKEDNKRLEEKNLDLEEKNVDLEEKNVDLEKKYDYLVLKELKLETNYNELKKKLNNTILELEKDNKIEEETLNELEEETTIGDDLNNTIDNIKNFFLNKISKLQILYIDLQKEYLCMTKYQFNNNQEKFKKSKDLYCPFPEEIKPLVFVKDLQNSKLNNTYVKLSGYLPKTNTYIIENTNINIKNKHFIYSPHMKN